MHRIACVGWSPRGGARDLTDGAPRARIRFRGPPALPLRGGPAGCGLIGVVVPVVGAVGRILGLYALRDPDQHPAQRGRGRAFTGIILGGLGTGLWLLWVVAILMRR